MYTQTDVMHTAAESFPLGAEHLLTEVARFPRAAVYHPHCTVHLQTHPPAMSTLLALSARPPPCGATNHRRRVHVCRGLAHVACAQAITFGHRDGRARWPLSFSASTKGTRGYMRKSQNAVLAALRRAQVFLEE